jgi:hypothetical protein
MTFKIVADGPNGWNCPCGVSYAAGNPVTSEQAWIEHAANFCRLRRLQPCAQPQTNPICLGGPLDGSAAHAPLLAMRYWFSGGRISWTEPPESTGRHLHEYRRVSPSVFLYNGSAARSAFACGRLARLRGCFRILVNANEKEHRDWLAGWDAADRELKAESANMQLD